MKWIFFIFSQESVTKICQYLLFCILSTTKLWLLEIGGGQKLNIYKYKLEKITWYTQGKLSFFCFLHIYCPKWRLLNSTLYQRDYRLYDIRIITCLGQVSGSGGDPTPGGLSQQVPQRSEDLSRGLEGNQTQRVAVKTRRELIENWSDHIIFLIRDRF